MDRDLILEAECLRDELAEFDQAVSRGDDATAIQAATQQLAAVVDKVALVLQAAKPHWTTLNAAQRTAYHQLVALVPDCYGKPSPGGQSGRTMPYRDAFFVWLTLFICTILNSTIREQYLAPAVGPRTAQLVGCGLLSALIGLIAVLYIKHLDGGSLRLGWQIGAFWLVLTVTFAVVLGPSVLSLSGAEVIADYYFLHGRCGPLVGLVMLLAPPLAAGFFGHRQGEGGI